MLHDSLIPEEAVRDGWPQNRGITKQANALHPAWNAWSILLILVLLLLMMMMMMMLQ